MFDFITCIFRPVLLITQLPLYRLVICEHRAKVKYVYLYNYKITSAALNFSKLREDTDVKFASKRVNPRSFALKLSENSDPSFFPAYLRPGHESGSPRNDAQTSLCLAITGVWVNDCCPNHIALTSYAPLRAR